MPEPFRFYGVREASDAASEIDRSVEEIRISGYTIVAGVLSESELEIVRQKLDEIYQIQVKEIGGEARLAEINDVKVVRLLFAYDDYFFKVATNPTMLEIVQHLLSDYFILME